VRILPAQPVLQTFGMKTHYIFVLMDVLWIFNTHRLDCTSQGFFKGEVKRIAAKLPIVAKTNKTANIFYLPLSIIFYRFPSPFNIYSDNIGCIHSL
jgi:hypothetical protein